MVLLGKFLLSVDLNLSYPNTNPNQLPLKLIISQIMPHFIVGPLAPAVLTYV